MSKSETLQLDFETRLLQKWSSLSVQAIKCGRAPLEQERACGFRPVSSSQNTHPTKKEWWA